MLLRSLPWSPKHYSDALCFSPEMVEKLNSKQSRSASSATIPPSPECHTLRTPVRTVWYHIYTLWLFTFSDLITIVVPKTAFGIITLLSGQTLTTNPQPEYLATLLSAPCIVAWIWLNLLPLAVINQYDDKSVIEDKENKPWRPIPSERLTRGEARTLSRVGYLAALLASSYLGGMVECLLLIAEGWIYNELEGANESLLARNFLNAAGYITFASGAARVGCVSSDTQMHAASLLWLPLLGGVIFSTIQIQDLYDQQGDAVRGRRTIPLLAGERLARLSIAIPVVVWSWVCPAFWVVEPWGFATPITLGAILIFRLYQYRGRKEDKVSFLIWIVWIISLYLLPLTKTIIEAKEH